MSGKTKYFLILILAMIFADASSQNSQVMYFMNLPQNHFLNPALRPSNSLYIGLPALSGFDLNINNNFVNFSDVFLKNQTSDSLFTFLQPDNNASINKFLSKIKDKNSFEPGVMTQLLGFGLSVGNNSYVFLDINERIEGDIVLPGDFFKLALNGNEGFVGHTIDMSSLRGSMMAYNEIGLGFSKNFTNKLRIGVKGKLLFGIASALIDNKSLGITVNDDYSHTLNGDMTFNISAPADFYTSRENIIDSVVFNDNKLNADFFSGTKNMGLGIDIGATYELTDNIVLSAAITDLGFIKWKNYVTNLEFSSKFDFSGFDLLDVINGTKTFDEIASEMGDSLKNSVNISNTNKPFTTFLPFGVTVGGNYMINQKFSAGLISYTRFIGKQIREAITMSANANLSNILSASLSYTLTNHRYDNFGAGLAVRAGTCQFYIMSDRIPVYWNKIVSDKNDIVLPANWNTINLRLGLNLVFGNHVKTKNDTPMISVQ
jgi:hypothetical protein